MAISALIPIRATGAIKENAKSGGIPSFTGGGDIRYFNVGAHKPGDIDINNSRITFATDICFTGDYMSRPGNHLVLTGRVNPSDPLDHNGGNGWAGIAIGELWGNGRVMAEERLLSGNKHPEPTSAANAIVPHQWYRFTLDLISIGGARHYEIRVHKVNDELTNVRGAQVFSSGTLVCTSTLHASDLNLVIAGINVTPTAGDFIVGRCVAYWSHYSEWVSNP